MNKSTHYYLGCVLALMTFAPNQAFAQCEQSYTSYSQDYVSPHASGVVLDSWMQPKVLRTRQITDVNGNVADVSEPIIMERHEKVMLPMEKEIITTTSSRASRSIEESTVSSGSSRRLTRNYVAHRAPHRTIAHHYGAQHTYIAKRRIETNPVRTVVDRQVIERAVTIERKDPALDMY